MTTLKQETLIVYKSEASRR